MQLGVDFSQWGGNLSPETVRAWKQNGVRYAIVQYSTYLEQHISTLINTEPDIERQGYVYLYWNPNAGYGSATSRTLNALQRFGKNITMLWLDAEDSTAPFNKQALWDCVKLCQQAGMPCGIYTGKWWWDANAQGVTEFSILPLWDAYYLATATNADLSKMPLTMRGFRPYGGWVKPLIWQWHNSTIFCGHSVDLNAREEVAPIPAPNEDDDTMIRHNKIADWFDGREFTEGSDVYVMQAQSDFGLPDDARYVTFAVWMDGGETVFFDGNSMAEAGRAGARGTNYVVIPDVRMADARPGVDGGKTINFKVETSCKIGRVMSVGYKR